MTPLQLIDINECLKLYFCKHDGGYCFKDGKCLNLYVDTIKCCLGWKLIYMWQSPISVLIAQFYQISAHFSNCIFLQNVLFVLLGGAGQEIFEFQTEKLFMRHPTISNLLFCP